MASKQNKAAILAFAALLATTGMASATQYVAATFNYPREFGGGLADVAGHRIYAPWAYAGWYVEYGESYRQPFDLAALLGLAVAGLPAGVAVGLARRRSRRVKKFGVEAWGTIADAKKAGLIDDKQRPVGRVIGKFEGKRLTYRGVEHSLIVGASRSGKGVGHVIPTACAWDQSLFVYDRKGEIWHTTADHRKRFSHTFYFAPTDPHTARWNPLFEIRRGPTEIADTQNLVMLLVDSNGAKGGHLDFFDRASATLLVGVILHVLYTAPDEQKNLAHVRKLLMHIEPTIDAMLGTKHRLKPDLHAPDGLARDERGEPIPEVHPEVFDVATAYRSLEDKVRTNILATAREAVTLFADPLVAHATSWSDFTIGDLVCAEAPVSFYLITPQAHADRLAFIVRVLLRSIINGLMEHIGTDNRGRPKRHRLLAMIDEFPKLGKLPFLENALGEMAGYGITAYLVCQSFNDIFASYTQYTSIFDNVHITVAFATSEPGSIERVVKRAGKSLEYRTSYSSPSSIFGKGNHSKSESEAERYILAEQDVRGLDASKQFLFVNNCKPLIADKLRFYEDAWFRSVTCDFHSGQLASFKQTRDTLDVPGKPVIDWEGVRPIEAYSAPDYSNKDDIIGASTSIAATAADLDGFDTSALFEPIEALAAVED